MYANYRKIEGLISGRKNFEGNSVTGKIEGEKYQVYSYSTLIAEIMGENFLTYFDNRYFSVTTSKIQNIICRLFGRKTKRGYDDKK